jgi:uridine phosphorylase
MQTGAASYRLAGANRPKRPNASAAGGDAMTYRPALVNPVRPKRGPAIGPVAVMASSQADLEALRRRLCGEGQRARPLFNSSLYCGDRISLIGPLIGAPYAVMLMETLIAWGVERFIFLGWCGAVSPSVVIGDVILSTAAVVDEGTSPHYGFPSGETVHAPAGLLDAVRKSFSDFGVPVKEGIVWSTDAIYRETRQKVAFYQARQVLAVEMELSALFAVAHFRQVAVAAVLVVSDELGSFVWRPGFKDERFKKARTDAVAAVEDLCRNL